jgi:WD40 repeat protein
VPESLATLILKCIAKKPEDRPSSMAALRTELVEVHTQVVGEVYMRDPPQAAELRADALNNRAVSMWELDRKQDAFAAWKDAIQVDQLHLEAVYNQEVTRWREGQSSDLDVVQRLEQLRMELPAESREGAEASGEPVVRPLTKATRKRRARQERTAKKKQEHASATPEAESELALVSKRAQIGLYLGYVHLERASADEAETELVAALADPVLAKNGTAWVALGDAQMAQEKFAEAGSAYEAARTVMPADTLVRERGELSARAARSHDDRIQFPWFHCKRVLKEPGNQPISISPDGSLIVSVDAGALHNTLIVTDLVSGRCLRKVPAHTKAVRALAVTPDGRFVVSGSDDDSLRLWEISTGAREWTFQGYAKEAPDDAAKGVTSLAVTPDGRFVISGHKDKTIQMRDLTTGSCVRSLERQARGISALAITADGRFIVSGNDDGTLCVWDLNTGALLRKLRGHSQKISSLAVVRDHSMVISGGLDGTVRLWDPDAGTLLRTFEIRTHWVNAVAGTPNGRFVLSSSYHYSLERGGEVSGAAIRLWDWGTGACLRTINLDVEQAHTRRRGTVNALAVTPDGRFIISEGDDAALRMWELESDAPRHRAPLQVCRAQLHAAVDSSKRRFDEHLQVATSAVASDQIESAYHHLAKARSVEGYERDPRALALNVSLANCIPVVGLRNAWLQRTFETPAVVRAVAVTHDGCFAVSGSDDAVVRLWEIDTGTCKQTFKGHSKRVTCVAVVPDSRRVISGSDDGDLRLWDLNAASCVRTFAGHTDKVVAVAVTPDGRLALSASQRSVSPGQPAELRWWQLDSGVCSRAAKSLAREGTALAVTPDGRLAVAAGNTADRGSGSTLNLWDVMTGGHLRALEGHPSREAHPLKVDWGVLAVAVSPDGRFVVSASKDRTLALWELETGRRVRSFDGHTSAVNALTVTRDGRFAFSGSDDGTIRLWDLETGKCLRTLEQAAGAVSALALTPDGRFLISASNDISLWELDWELDVRMYVALPEPEKARRLNQVNAQRMAMQSAHRALAEAAQLTSRKSGLFARVASFFVRKGLG